MQNKKQSMLEAVISTITGYLVSAVITYNIFDVTVLQSLNIGVVYTVASLIRGYGIRRIFNRINKKDKEFKN